MTAPVQWGMENNTASFKSPAFSLTVAQRADWTRLGAQFRTALASEQLREANRVVDRMAQFAVEVVCDAEDFGLSRGTRWLETVDGEKFRADVMDVWVDVQQWDRGTTDDEVNEAIENAPTMWSV